MLQLPPPQNDQTDELVSSMTTKHIEFIDSMPELLRKALNEDPTQTKADVFQLPNTPQLQECFCMTFCGPEARVLASMMVTVLDSISAAANAKTD
jgi:hypothetical protein